MPDTLAKGTEGWLMGDFGIGAAVRRKEDFRFLTGQGTYTDDINRPGQLYAFLLRSPHAHAELGAIDTAAAKAAPGVSAVFTGADLQVGGLPCGWLVTSKDGKPMIEPPHPLLAQGKVRHVGDPVAVVVAETLEQAKDAAELIEVSYKTLPAVVTSEEAIKPGSPLLFDTAPGNLCFDWHLGDKAAVDAAFSRAHHITRLDLVNNRLVSNPMEPRAATGEFDRGTSEYTLYTTSQAPHVHRLLIAAFVLQLPEHKLRVVAPDVGGGFGTKGSLYAEQALVLWLAGKLGRPVKWTAERSEIFLTDNQARDHVTKAELALDKDGKFLAHAGRHAGQSRCLSRQLRPGNPDLVLRYLARRQLRDPRDLCRGQGRLHQHRASRRLSRRWAARGLLRGGAPRRPRRARDEARPLGTATAQLRPQRRLSLYDACFAHL